VNAFKLSILIIGCLSINLMAQLDVNELPSKKILKVAQNAEELGDVYSAMDYYSLYVEKEPTDYANQFKLGQLCMAARDYKKAQNVFDSLYYRSPELFTQALFYSSMMKKMQGNYKEAMEGYKKFKQVYKGRDLAKRTENEIKGCEMGLKDKQGNVDIIHLNKDINKPHIEFSPVLMDENTMIYGSLDVDSIPIHYKSEKTPIPFRKLFMAKRQNAEEWVRSNDMPLPVNFQDAHSGNGSFSPDGKRFYFTKCYTALNNKPLCEIFVTENTKNEGWSAPIKLPAPVNVAEYSSTMPTIGTEVKKGMVREILYFASNRPTRSEGGFDIWYSAMELPDSNFAKVENVGRKINTPGNELTPYFDNKSRIFYFSSDFWPGYGGLDIFKARGSSAKFQNIENIGFPINSSADDLYYMSNQSKREEGFFVSNRTGSNTQFNPNCCDDIYSFINKDFIDLTAKGDVAGKLHDLSSPNNGDLLQGAIAMLYMVMDTAGSSGDVESLMYISSDTTGKDGSYFLELEKNAEYRVMIKRDGFFYKQIGFNTKNKTRSEQLALEKAELEEISNKPYVFYIYYDVDQSDITTSSARTIDSVLLKVLSETPDIIVELSSHTDSQGDSLYNQKLSQARADKVVGYLTTKGIDKNRLIAKGYGEEKPIAANDTPENMALNRRTEFSVVGSIDPFSKLNTSKFRIIKPEDKKPEVAKPSKPSKSGVVQVNTPGKPTPKKK